MEIQIIKSQNLKQKPDFKSELGFGKYFSDHMFVMDYNLENGWHNPRVEPYHNLSLDPSAMVFHYGQEVFEGLKAYRCMDGSVQLFRPYMNARRLNVSNERLGIPQFDEEMFVESLKALVNTDIDWVPNEVNTSYYLRPFIIATEAGLGVRASTEYQYVVIGSPTGSFYKEGLNPVKIYIEDEYVRAVRGGIGLAKTGGNYASSIKAQIVAKSLGFTQVLWLDGVERKYIEEVGAMNIFFKINGKVITPSLNGSILAGITRDSVIKVCEDEGYVVEERRISVDELEEALKNGQVEEVFGSGTAAVISPVCLLRIKGVDYQISNGQTGPLSNHLYQTIFGIQKGEIEDKYNWTVKVK